jgi:hypothetical protein
MDFPGGGGKPYTFGSPAINVIKINERVPRVARPCPDLEKYWNHYSPSRFEMDLKQKRNSDHRFNNLPMPFREMRNGFFQRGASNP